MTNWPKKKITMVMLITLLIVILDQWTKQWAIDYLKNKEAIYFFDGIFQLVYAENPGAFLGMGGELSRPVRFIVFGLLVAVGLGLMFWSIIKNKITPKELYAYSFILAGGIGNVIDRLSHANGHVVDFMYVDLKFASFMRTGVFNLADVAIVAGVILVLVTSYKQEVATSPKVLESSEEK